MPANMQLSEILPRAAAVYPEKTAVICGPVRLTNREVAARVGRLASALAGLGVRRGDRVALLHHNCHRVLEAYFGAVHAGAVLVPLNYRLTASDLAYILDDTSSRVLLADDGHAELARTPCTIVPGRDYEALLERTDDAALGMTEDGDDDPVNLYYTSGTTGHQKGVVLTHRNVYSHALATIAELALADADVWIHVAPMFHLADAWATWAVTWVGGRHVMVGKFEPDAVLRAMVEERVTVTNLVPTMLNDLVHHNAAERLDFPALRLLMSGGAPISPSLVRRVVETFGAEYVQTYGLTETSPYLTFSLLKEHQRRLPPDEQMRYRSMTGRAATPEELVAHCRERLAHYKCPGAVEIVDKLPRTGSGKLSKRTLRHR